MLPARGDWPAVAVAVAAAEEVRGSGAKKLVYQRKSARPRGLMVNWSSATLARVPTAPGAKGSCSTTDPSQRLCKGAKRRAPYSARRAVRPTSHQVGKPHDTQADSWSQDEAEADDGAGAGAGADAEAGIEEEEEATMLEFSEAELADLRPVEGRARWARVSLEGRVAGEAGREATEVRVTRCARRSLKAYSVPVVAMRRGSVVLVACRAAAMASILGEWGAEVRCVVREAGW